MRTEEYQKISFSKFNGWYARGDKDTVPLDHAVDCQNVWLNDPGNITIRPGSKTSFTMSHIATNLFVATPNAGTFFLTMDTYGNLYKELGNNSTLITSVPGAIDFVGLNMFGRVYLNFIKSSGPAEPIKVWDGINPVRNAAGAAPKQVTGGRMTCTVLTGSGNVSVGLHKLAVCFVTDTGFVTPPGPILTDVGNVFTPAYGLGTGNCKLSLSNIPIGPIGTTSRLILMTKGDEEQYFKVPNGIISDNTSTTFTIDVADEELFIDGSYLFDNLPSIPGGIGDGGLNKYKGRLLVWGGEADLVRASYSGDPESFSNVTGAIQLPSETDGNYVKGCFILRDVLYFTKPIGIFATQDLTSEEPSSWPVTIIDGSVGSWNSGVSTITSSQSGLPMNDVLLLVDLEGVHVFNGGVLQPALTWKIDDIWKVIPKNSYQKITITVDPFQRVIYILAPDSAYPLLVGDYTEGLDAEHIKWTHWVLPFVPRAMALANVQDIDSWDYYLRVSDNASNRIVKMVNDVRDDSGSPIESVYQFPYTPIEVGCVNLFRGIRLRAKGTGTLFIRLLHEDEHMVDTKIVPLDFTPVKDYLREINTMNEKLSISLITSGIQYNLTRLDLFGKVKFRSRPA